jgi:hypothetical protein
MVKGARIKRKFTELKERDKDKLLCGNARLVVDPTTGVARQVPRKGTHYRSKFDAYADVINTMLAQGVGHNELARRLNSSAASLAYYLKTRGYKNQADGTKSNKVYDTDPIIPLKEFSRKEVTQQVDLPALRNLPPTYLIGRVNDVPKVRKAPKVNIMQEEIDQMSVPF